MLFRSAPTYPLQSFEPGLDSLQVEIQLNSPAPNFPLRGFVFPNFSASILDWPTALLVAATEPKWSEGRKRKTQYIERRKILRERPKNGEVPSPSTPDLLADSQTPAMGNGKKNKIGGAPKQKGRLVAGPPGPPSDRAES